MTHTAPLRLDHLYALPDGWLDGEGHAPRHTDLDWFQSRWLQHWPTDLPTPLVYPTVSGDVVLEWSLRSPGNRIFVLEVNLYAGQAGLLKAPMSAAEEDPEESLYDLERPGDWLALATEMRALLKG